MTDTSTGNDANQNSGDKTVSEGGAVPLYVFVIAILACAVICLILIIVIIAFYKRNKKAAAAEDNDIDMQEKFFDKRVFCLFFMYTYIYIFLLLTNCYFEN